MPRIPTYESQVGISSQGPAVRADVGSAGMVFRGIAAAGDALSDEMNRVDMKIRNIKQLEEMSKFSVDSSSRIMDLHQSVVNSPDFVSDPEGASERFKQSADQLRSTYLQQIQDPEVKLRWQTHFDNEVLSRQGEIGVAARKQRIASGIGTAEDSLYKLSNLAGKAQNEDEFTRYIGQGVGIIRGMAAGGVYKPEDAVKREHEFVSKAIGNKAKWDILNDPEGAYERLSKRSGIYGHLQENDARPLLELAQKRSEYVTNQTRIEQERKQREAEQAELNGALKEMQTMFPGDTSRQAEYAANTENYPGMDLQKRSTLVSSIKSEGERLKGQHEKWQKDYDEALYTKFLSSGLSDVDIKASAASPKLKDDLLQANQKSRLDRGKTDPEVHKEVLTKIWNGEISSRAQIAKYIGSGIGADKAEELAKSIEEAKDPSKSKFFKYSEDLYKARFKEDPEMLARASEFAVLLDHHVRTEKLTGEAIFKKAQDLMLPAAGEQFNTWFNRLVNPESTKPVFLRELEGNPVVQLPQETIAPDRRRKVIEYLRLNQKAVSEDSIKYVDSEWKKVGR